MARRGGMSNASSKVAWWKLQDSANSLQARMLRANRHGITADEVYEAFVNPADVQIFRRAEELGFFEKDWYINKTIELQHNGFAVTLDLDPRPVPANALKTLDSDSPILAKLTPWMEIQREIKDQWVFVKYVLTKLQETRIQTVAPLRYFLPGTLTLLAMSGAGAVDALRDYHPIRNNIDLPMNLVRACQRASTIIASSQLVDDRGGVEDLVITAEPVSAVNPLIAEYGL